MQDDTDAMQRKLLKLSEAVTLYQHELAQVRAAHEPLQEQCGRLRVERDHAEAAADQLARSLARHLSKKYWEDRRPPERIGWGRFIGSRWPWLRTLFGARQSLADADEHARVRLIEASPLFDAGWYLRQNPDVARAGIHPASHFLHAGGREGRDPGPDFDVADYLSRHPELVGQDINPLLHQLQSRYS